MKKKRKEWSPNGYLFAAYRKIWRWSPQRRQCLLQHESKGRLACVSCKGLFKREDVAVDHALPVVDPSTGFTSWDDYYKRLFCPLSNLQILCKKCHQKKSNEERRIRRENKKKQSDV